MDVSLVRMLGCNRNVRDAPCMRNQQCLVSLRACLNEPLPDIRDVVYISGDIDAHVTLKDVRDNFTWCALVWVCAAGLFKPPELKENPCIRRSNVGSVPIGSLRKEKSEDGSINFATVFFFNKH